MTRRPLTQPLPLFSATVRRRMVARRVRGGFTAEQSAEVLAELEAQVSVGDNLVHALVEEGFATEQQATAYVAAQQEHGGRA